MQETAKVLKYKFSSHLKCFVHYHVCSICAFTSIFELSAVSCAFTVYKKKVSVVLICVKVCCQSA